ncbi:hypothetical protein AM501_23255 [Aneurinibacillus migulanus]|uniref:Ribosomal protein L7/L12 C-terminal domain n=1 Tax=Aneurinibacillus migulanus TaxID=47500 RepID=A0A0D1XTC4_ANEMI|nr:hypothetical protein [Aneurinibacillus migulanus]KIV55079.1 hypothetical protein TS64_12465 [Aneurinibacillus migulanus]KIV55403.1 hypothetical protein TS65_16365 [Aneurinibacillus migulanus]KON95257.1 hypothetical protein AF333_06970 [Aneurinibacillus migulanus]KPD06149.1 hypothetical protein AM501_23255 [Aneurinibacillus migulanus]MCP1355484.1 hypothetical protein [Aneurinibacillus migulanus]
MEYTFIGALVVLLGLIILNKIAIMEKQIKNQKFILDQISKQLEIPEHPVNNEVRKLLKEQNYVEAIKMVREVLGLSLIEAKQYVDRIKNG